MQQYFTIGVMSGSSLDGLDIAYCSFTFTNNNWTFEILNAECKSFKDDIAERLRHATKLSAYDFVKLDIDLGHYIGREVRDFIAHYNIQKLDFIASHGHTVFHHPEFKFTAQIGDGSAIAALTGFPVINQFRSLDVALGGQGAPVVPIGEKYLFENFADFLNLGGIANIAIHKEDNIIAFDVCAANQVLNYLAQSIGEEYDKNGDIARSGKVNHELLHQLNDLKYFEMLAPKSLDNSFTKDHILPILNFSTIAIADKLATATEHIAIQIHNALSKFSFNDNTLMITGGGAFNTFLVERIKTHSTLNTFIPPPTIVNFKEALVIAFMGVLRWEKKINVLKSVTGASQSSVNGAIYYHNKSHE